MAPRYRAEVDESGHPTCPKKHRLRPLAPEDYDSSSSAPSPQASPRSADDPDKSLSSPSALKPVRSALRKRDQQEKTVTEDLGIAREPSSSSTARPNSSSTARPMTSPASVPISPVKPPPLRSALRSKPPDCSNPQEPADGDESPQPKRSALKQKKPAPPPEDVPVSSSCKAPLEVASPPVSPPASPPKSALRSALRGGSSRPAPPEEQKPPPSPQKSPPKSALKSSNASSPPRPGRKISVMCSRTNGFVPLDKANLQPMGELKEEEEEADDPGPKKGGDPPARVRAKPMGGRAGQRMSIWDDPLGDSARGVLYRVYRFAEQHWLWTVELENSKQRECARSSITVELDDDPSSPRLQSKEDNQFEEAQSESGHMRRPSRVILKQVQKGAAAVRKMQKGAAGLAAPSGDAAGEEEGEEEEEKPPKEMNPLRGILTSKKVDVNRLREAINEIEPEPERLKWLEEKLEIGPPMVPSALWQVIAMGRPDLVSLVLEYSIDVTKVYDGPSIYMGSVKPGSTALECVKNRKGRFVGTMLGDRLELIEGLLSNAAKRQAEKATAEYAVFSDKEVSRKRGKRITTTISARGETVYTHTQGHPIQCYEIDEPIKGHYMFGPQDSSSCLMGFHKESFNPVAIKVSLKSENGGAEEALIWEEISILRKLKHSNILHLVETFEDDAQIFVVLELCKGGPLFDRLQDESGKNESLQERHHLRLIRQLADSVSYIHHRHICHRDIQPCNFLLQDQRPLQEGIVKLIDFSTAKGFGGDCPAMKTKICTPSYVAPEILHRADTPYSELVDVWSLGVVFFVILCGSLPFHGETEVETLKRVRRGNLKFQPQAIWDTVSEEAKDCVRKMLVKKPEERCNASQVTEHPWLSKGKEA